MNFMARSCKESTFSFLLLLHEPLRNYINSNVLAYMPFYIDFDFSFVSNVFLFECNNKWGGGATYPNLESSIFVTICGKFPNFMKSRIG